MNGTLVGLGTVAWTDLIDLTRGMTCAWADYEGFHVGSCPILAPPYTHLWAWSGDGTRTIRVRIDSGQPIVGMLLLGDHDGPIGAPLVEDVTVREGGLKSWPVNDRSVGEQEPGVLTDVRIYDVAGTVPLRFIAGPVGPHDREMRAAPPAARGSAR